jgi:hypothetical protein
MWGKWAGKDSGQLAGIQESLGLIEELEGQ